jgi:hypothetical protein
MNNHDISTQVVVSGCQPTLELTSKYVSVYEGVVLDQLPPADGYYYLATVKGICKCLYDDDIYYVVHLMGFQYMDWILAHWKVYIDHAQIDVLKRQLVVIADVIHDKESVYRYINRLRNDRLLSKLT